MRVFRRLTIPVMLALLLGIVGSAGPRPIAGHPATAAVASTPSYTLNQDGLFIFVPSNAVQQQPLQVLVAIHGMGGNGPQFCQDLLAAADRNGWIVVAPTFKYQDYKNVDLVLQDDTTFIPQIAATLDALPARTGLLVRDKVLLYGHSRGAQMVHRFATVYPERVAGVAAISAGSYTLPLNTMLVNGRSVNLPLPYGVLDLRRYLGHDFDYAAFKQVPFRVEVGGADDNPNDTPRAWDPYLGQTRVARARTYAKALADIGVNVTLQVYPGAGHGVSPAMHDDALRFLEGVLAQHANQYGKAPARGVAAYGATVTAAMRGRR
jgi:predicted esterase